MNSARVQPTKISEWMNGWSESFYHQTVVRMNFTCANWTIRSSALLEQRCITHCHIFTEMPCMRINYASAGEIKTLREVPRSSRPALGPSSIKIFTSISPYCKKFNFTSGMICRCWGGAKEREWLQLKMLYIYLYFIFRVILVLYHA